MWLAAYCAEGIDRTNSFGDAEEWFTGRTELATQLPKAASDSAILRLDSIGDHAYCVEMLPYILDPLPHAYRRDALGGDKAATAARAARKDLGAFYTPADVAEHIVGQVLNAVTRNGESPTVLDPACGTGVFLRAASRSLAARALAPEHIVQLLHGVDLDECAVEMCAFVLTTEALQRMGARVTPMDLWESTRSRLLCGDALLALASDRAPGVTAADGRTFDALVGNPPYAKLGDRTDRSVLAQKFASLRRSTGSTDAFVAFVELMWRAVAAGGAAGLVIPMSIGFSTTAPLIDLRDAAQMAGGDWRFEFFDRTPDALFGDDIKQRTAIAIRADTPEYKVSTTAVRRWSSESRGELFAQAERVPLGSLSLRPGIPKVGSVTQREAFSDLERAPRLAAELLRSRRVSPREAGGERRLYLAATAYNWLSVYRHGKASCTGNENPSTTPLIELECGTSKEADAIYAVMISRIAFWLWRVQGDGFHVTSNWVEQVPFPKDSPEHVARLASVGKAAWRSISKNATRSLNKGKTTISYCPYTNPDLLDEIDGVLIDAFELPLPFASELQRFVTDLTVAGRDNSTSLGVRRAFASWGGNEQS